MLKIKIQLRYLAIALYQSPRPPGGGPGPVHGPLGIGLYKWQAIMWSFICACTGSGLCVKPSPSPCCCCSCWFMKLKMLQAAALYWPPALWCPRLLLASLCRIHKNSAEIVQNFLRKWPLVIFFKKTPCNWCLLLEEKPCSGQYEPFLPFVSSWDFKAVWRRMLRVSDFERVSVLGGRFLLCGRAESRTLYLRE